MPQVSWLLCCEEFVVKENGLCDAHDLLFEIHTDRVPVVGAVGIDVVALWRSDQFESEPPLTVRMAIIASDGSLHPSNEAWTLSFTSPQVLWFKRITDLFLPLFGFTSIAVQALEDGEWLTKKEYPIMVIQG